MSKEGGQNYDESGMNWQAILSEPKFGTPPNKSSLQPALEALQNLQDSLKCFYCQKIFREPVIAIEPCHHCFCGRCFSQAWAITMQDSSHMTCPICNATVEGNLKSCHRNEGLENTVQLYRTMQPLLLKSLEGLASSPSSLLPSASETTPSTAIMAAVAAATTAAAAAPTPAVTEMDPSSAGVAEAADPATTTDAAAAVSSSIKKKKKMLPPQSVLPKCVPASKPTLPIKSEPTPPASKPTQPGSKPTQPPDDAEAQHVSTAQKTSWDYYFLQLVAFQREHGHTRVRYRNDGDTEFKKFSDWVRNQRYLLARRLGEEGPIQMAPIYHERIDRLNSIGFDWSASAANDPAVCAKVEVTAQDGNSSKFQAKWETMFEELRRFYSEHGHTHVERHSQDNKKLHDWARNQKYMLGKKLRDGRLSPTSAKRVEKLDSVLFSWRSSSGHFSNTTAPLPITPASKPKLTKTAAQQWVKTSTANDSALAATLGKVLGALDNLGALNHLEGAGGGGGGGIGVTAAAAAANPNGGATAGQNRKRPASLEATAAAGTPGNRKRAKLERRLEMVSNQLKDAEQNVVRFQTVRDSVMAEQAKARMVDLYNKKVELEQSILTAAEGDNEDGFSTVLQQRAKLEKKLALVSKHLADAETSVARFQGIHDEAMMERAKLRMGELYNHKVVIENEMMEMDDDDDEEEEEEEEEDTTKRSKYV